MSEKEKVKNGLRAYLATVFFGLVIYLLIRNLTVFGNLLLAMFSIGVIVLVHEFGHFVVAKVSDIKVEAFWIFMPPMLLGVRRTADGIRFRILPKFFPRDNDESGDGYFSFTVGKKGEESETEYRIGLIPFGGFVKMLGQEDIGSVKSSDDPRSYSNKPVGVRMGVISAGVIFNALSALIVFMIVFLIGIRLIPAVVGGVVPGSAAARAGLRAGDEIIAIDGKGDNLDFSSIAIAAALSDRDEEVVLKVKHLDGSVEDFGLVAEQKEGEQMKRFGVSVPMSLTIAKVRDADALVERTGLL
ncbi:MAG: site-2 protease family protein, partial [Planctomycetota bacterium]